MQSLRKALRIMGAPNLLADNMEYGLSYSVVSYLKKLSQQVRSLDVELCFIHAHIAENVCILRCNQPNPPFILFSPKSSTTV